jgi:hypothetical protein
MRDDGPGQAHRHSHLPTTPHPRVPAQQHNRRPRRRHPHCPFVCLMDAFPVSRAAEVVGTDHDDDHVTALYAVGRRGRQRNPGDRRRRLMLSFAAKAASTNGDVAALFRETRAKRVRRPSLARSRGTRRPRFLSSPPPPPPPPRRPRRTLRGPRLSTLGLTCAWTSKLRLREQALHAASGGVPLLPGVEEFARAMNQAGVRTAVAASSPTRLLEAKKSAGREEFFAMFEGVPGGDGVQCGTPEPGIFGEGHRGSRRGFALLGRTVPKAKI